MQIIASSYLSIGLPACVDPTVLITQLSLYQTALYPRKGYPGLQEQAYSTRVVGILGVKLSSQGAIHQPGLLGASKQ